MAAQLWGSMLRDSALYQELMKKTKIEKELAEKEEAELLEETPPATAPPRDPRSNSI